MERFGRVWDGLKGFGRAWDLGRFGRVGGSGGGWEALGRFGRVLEVWQGTTGPPNVWYSWPRA